ncbi:hypothetical protein AK812_SmicGene23072 [Symbiodinium microadriaticum]|uniref:Transmembrane protein n=1 Tax=Symbiodinium microadriaticum TaxID=2951 RepID=A0A1Q9DI39_SYMMI|nr:hypothetical protein AK812_SmicGene23072 [Symbiodinium microadriaticum]
MGLVTTSSLWWSLDFVILVALLVSYYDFSSTFSAVVTSWWRRLWLAWSFWAQDCAVGLELPLPDPSVEYSFCGHKLLFEVTSLFLLIVGLSDCSLFLLGVYLHHP